MEPIEYDELSMFHENAEEFDIPYFGPPVVRREFVAMDDNRRLSALLWGATDPELVFLDGGAQNAHTWDTLALALARPLVAIDLPGHGYSDRARRNSLDVIDNARDIATVVRAVAPDAAAVIGMSLGGMTALALADCAPELVPKLVLVDITPGVSGPRADSIRAFVDGPESFDSFDDILARTIAFNPSRSVSSLRRGILHNAEQREDGSWVWRYARFRAADTAAREPAQPGFTALWDVVSRYHGPLMLVRGMLPQSVVDDDQEAELRRRSPLARVEHIANAGHSVQGDTPIELSRLIDNFVG